MEVVLYTHSDYSDVWPLVFPNIIRNIRDFKIHVCINSSYTGELPDQFIRHTYDETDPYGKRIERCIKDISAEYLLFIHEDWIPIDVIYPSIITECISFMKTYNCEYLMSYASRYKIKDGVGIPTSVNGFIFQPVRHHFMQPAIWKTSMFRELCGLHKPISSNEDLESSQFTARRNCYGILNTRTLLYESSRSMMFPHIHAINRGKWTCVKYPLLQHILSYYDIDVTKRGIDTEWIPDTQ